MAKQLKNEKGQAIVCLHLGHTTKISTTDSKGHIRKTDVTCHTCDKTFTEYPR